MKRIRVLGLISLAALFFILFSPLSIHSIVLLVDTLWFMGTVAFILFLSFLSYDFKSFRTFYHAVSLLFIYNPEKEALEKFDKNIVAGMYRNCYVTALLATAVGSIFITIDLISVSNFSISAGNTLYVDVFRVLMIDLYSFIIAELIFRPTLNRLNLNMNGD